MRLLCLNTWGGRLRDPLLSFLRSQRESVDVFALQEVLDGSAPPGERAGVDQYAGVDLSVSPELYRLCARELSGFQGFLSGPYSSLGERLATFVRDGLTVGGTGQVELHPPLRQVVNDTSFRANSIAQHLQVSDGGLKLRVVNTHGMWIAGGKDDTPERLQQSERLDALVSEFRDPTVLCGDFNLLPNTQSIRILEKGLRNLVREYGVSSTRSRLSPASKGKFADYVFVTPTLRVAAFRVLEVLISDHLPLVLELDRSV